MAMKNLEELFEHELKDMYDVENTLIPALDKMAKESQSKSLKKAFLNHKRETTNQKKRLEAVFKMMEKKPQKQMCHGVRGLLKEKAEFSKEKPSKDLLDFFNIGAGQKTERYEITAYESLIGMARQLGMHKAADELSKSLNEEKKALENLKDIETSAAAVFA